ncbi:hypothetical protein POM88_031551 [Heracleum sosnowskyi]|uniref:Uncharacterized protein n=1 Tax=Heracleum sosnowskyi TaxID=360622 RepID=A0AAD8HZS2_9APIA|nr:hypothetical protein POM88_031551 [Heracleum sosnowskyi]
MVRYPTRRNAIRNHLQKRPIQLRPPSSRSLHNREYLLVKAEVQYYEEYINLVELRYGKGSKESSVFITLHRDCKEQRITVQEIQTRVEELFKDQEKLLLNFSKTVVPYLYPLATKDEVDRANQFCRIVKLAFPLSNNNQWKVIRDLILKFQDGRLTLKEMTVEMLKDLEYKDELIIAYMKFVPQSKNVVARIVIPRRLYFYLSRLYFYLSRLYFYLSRLYFYLSLIALLVAFGLVGLYACSCNYPLCFCSIASVLVLLY